MEYEVFLGHFIKLSIAEVDVKNYQCNRENFGSKK